jgi:hypothetical protein
MLEAAGCKLLAVHGRHRGNTEHCDLVDAPMCACSFGAVAFCLNSLFFCLNPLSFCLNSLSSILNPPPSV